MKVRKGVGCLFQGIATIVLIIIITILAKETDSPAILHWGIGMAVFYGIWGRNWNGSRKIESNNTSITEDEPPPLSK